MLEIEINSYIMKMYIRKNSHICKKMETQTRYIDSESIVFLSLFCDKKYLRQVLVCISIIYVAYGFTII